MTANGSHSYILQAGLHALILQAGLHALYYRLGCMPFILQAGLHALKNNEYCTQVMIMRDVMSMQVMTVYIIMVCIYV